MRLKIALCAGFAAAFAMGGVMLWPQARHSAALLAAHDDPATLSDLTLSATGMVVSPADIEKALAEGDVDLARSLIELATARGTPLPAETVSTVERAEADSLRRSALQFGKGLVTGEITDGASLGGTLVGDLLVFGDIRDLVREGHHLATGAEVDPVIMGLAGAGLAVTAATYASIGTATPVRAGLTMMKDARRAGRIGGELASTIKTAARAGKASDLLRMAKDVNRVRGAAGTRAAFDAMKIAEGPADIARAAKLAEKKGMQTRAVVKLLGRGALMLGAVAWQAASWIAWFAFMLIGFAASVKRMAERAAEGWIRRSKLRAARAKAAANTLAMAPA
jgi:hypothetical protein